VPARDQALNVYHMGMHTPDPFSPTNMPDAALDAYLLLCQEIYLEMERDGRWPWPDSHNSEDLLESKET